MPKMQLLTKKTMGVNNFSFCILPTRPQKHAWVSFSSLQALTP